MEDAGVWRATPALSTVDQCIGEWLHSTRRAADLLRLACRAVPAARSRRSPGPVVAYIDLTEDDSDDDAPVLSNLGKHTNNADRDGRGQSAVCASLVSAGVQPPPGDFGCPSHSLHQMHPYAAGEDNGGVANHRFVGDHGVDRRVGTYEKRHCNDDSEPAAVNLGNIDGSQEESDGGADLVRRRRRPRRDVPRKRPRRHNEIPPVSVDTAPPHRDSAARPTSAAPSTATGPVVRVPEAAPSAPCASLFDWDAFRHSLCDLDDPRHDQPRPLPETLFGAALFSPRQRRHQDAPLPCWNVSPLAAALFDLSRDMRPLCPVSIAVDQTQGAPAPAPSREVPALRTDGPILRGVQAPPHGTAPDPYSAASAPPRRLFAVDGGLKGCNSSQRTGAPPCPTVGVTMATRDPVVADKPAAGLGDAVLIHVADRRTVAVLDRFDGTHYHLVLAHATAADGERDGDRRIRLSVSGIDNNDGTHWCNAPLGECAVCMDAEADAFLGCRCTVPATCMACAARLDRCPHCDATTHCAPRPIERDLCVVPTTSPWIEVPLRIVLDGVRGPASCCVRAQVDWPGVLFKAIVHEIIGDARRDMRLLVGGRTIADQRPIGAQGVVDGALVCVVPRLRGD
ncbi:Ring domain containing protein [Pandoravirus salinus]|uniref:Ring domain containing protein n=1 Tax=Pandoravirus salinus TaxID=1349410 RepID=S4VUK3_9VIRU|nr:Ring domain [Pandoravirus salinus]AGO84234.1 Ring domain containing protein [Pandoravirus salinus]